MTEEIEEVAKPQVHLRCSACNKNLASILIADAEAIDPRTKKPFEWHVKATCPYCGDESFVQTIKGRIHPAGFALPNRDNCEDVYCKTFIDETEYEDGNKITFKVQVA